MVYHSKWTGGYEKSDIVKEKRLAQEVYRIETKQSQNPVLTPPIIMHQTTLSTNNFLSSEELRNMLLFHQPKLIPITLAATTPTALVLVRIRRSDLGLSAPKVGVRPPMLGLLAALALVLLRFLNTRPRPQPLPMLGLVTDEGPK